MDSTLAYLGRRILWVPVILFFVTFVTFALARFGPGDPVRVAAGNFRDPEAFERIRIARGLDKPIYEQYVIYMKGVLLHGDFGDSFRYRDYSVNEILFPAIWRSIQYNAVALFITLFIGIPLGVFAARKQGTWMDPASISSFLVLQSIPALITVPFALLFFALKLGVLPARGWPQDCPVQLSFLGPSYSCIGVFSTEAIIPILVLSLPGIAIWGRFTRAFTLDVMREDYVRTARSKGLSEYQVLTRHVLRNALLPLSTIVAFAFVGLIEGSFFVETLTGVPGAGRLSFESINGRDYDMIMAIVILGASLYVIVSIAIDVAYTVIDPRIRIGARHG
ncbi:MAG TPA: ABC transporter permease [Dehalococcoidia bacterium]|jgi:ABC-type dipeptide/oligopeptide/nickel transport system permease component|nr:ABC transporter permease [Dehalococcoidia bacterium]